VILHDIEDDSISEDSESESSEISEEINGLEDTCRYCERHVALRTVGQYLYCYDHQPSNKVIRKIENEARRSRQKENYQIDDFVVSDEDEIY